MILTYEQADRFYTLINALLGYANERFEVVRELPLPIVDLESQSKAALVAETLWDSVGIIDDFVRENPFDLPKRFLDTALAWKDALTGSFVFAGHDHGRRGRVRGCRDTVGAERVAERVARRGAHHVAAVRRSDRLRRHVERARH